MEVKGGLNLINGKIDLRNIDELDSDTNLENTRYITKELYKIRGIEVLEEKLDGNKVFFNMDRYNLNSENFVKYLCDNGVLIDDENNGEMCFVINCHVTKEDLDILIELMRLAE